MSWEIGRTLATLVIYISAFVSANHLPADNDQTSSALPDQWFDQYLDHFTITDNRQWKQRYQVITDNYKDGGPVFLEFGLQSLTGDDLSKHTSTAYAKKLGAMVFQLEIRFYGKSHPTSDVSTDNLVYLSTDQLLADAAYFIKAMAAEHKMPEGTKWIVFGFSFSAIYAAWMRQKYPHLVYGAVADSGPILAKVDFFEYENAVKEILENVSPNCGNVIYEGNQKIVELLKTPEGQKIVNEKFKLCDPIDVSNKHDLIAFWGFLADVFSEIAQYNGADPVTLEQECSILLDTSINDVVDRYAKVNSVYLEFIDSKCMEYKDGVIVSSMQNVSWEAELVLIGSRQFYYQWCTENGFFRSSVHPNDFFCEEIPLDWYIDRCKNIFGDNFNQDLAEKGVYRTNLMYGGLDSQATRVAYIYSSGDPWHVLGLTETKVAESPVFYIKGGRHQVLSEELTDSTAPEVKEVWNQVLDLVGKWCSS